MEGACADAHFTRTSAGHLLPLCRAQSLPVVWGNGSLHSSRPGRSTKAGALKILILGGYGVFGGRLVELLSDIPDLEMLICGRSQSRAAAYCAAYRGLAKVSPLAFDRKDIKQELIDTCPDLVVDASGPFQDYGDNGYVVIQACIASGVDYLDFADAADFVFGVSQFDTEARSAGVFVLSGVSSFPVLTAAVLRKMADTMDITSVEGGIAPSPYAGVGMNVMRAVVGYAGTPVKLMRNGMPAAAIGLAESRRYTIAVPGRLPLDNIHFSLVDVPDLQVIPPQHASLQNIWMGAGPGPEVLHKILNLLAKARATFGLPSMVPLSRLFYTVLNLMKFGAHRGGMYVHATGLRDGVESEQSWHLLAEGDDGPYIPAMAIEVIVRKVLIAERPEAGARPATNALNLEDYEKLFESRTIYSGFRGIENPAHPLYQRVLGPAFDALPKQVKSLHGETQARQWAGHARVRRGDGVLANLIGRIFGFPKASDKVPVRVDLVPEQGGERWTRDFDGTVFSSFQAQGTGKNSHLVTERFGPITVALALVIDGEKLLLIPRRWSFFGVRLPISLLPSGQGAEAERDGKFCFDVEIAAPVVGLIVAYQGELERV